VGAINETEDCHSSCGRSAYHWWGYGIGSSLECEQGGGGKTSQKGRLAARTKGANRELPQKLSFSEVKNVMDCLC
jgi:hypothetical protein